MSLTITPEKLYNVQDACRRIGISKSTLLRYEVLGLFPPAKRKQANGYRYYTEEDIQQLKSIVLGPCDQ